jgi:multiple sugar transport system permease protein
MNVRSAGFSPPRTQAATASMSPTQFGLILVAPVTVLLILIVAYPVGYSFYLSLYKFNPLTGAARQVGLDNYRTVLQDSQVWHALAVTLYYVTCVTALASLIALGSALVLRDRFFGRSLLVALVALPWSLSTYAAAVVWRYVYSPEYGLIAGIQERLGLHPVDFLSSATVVPALSVVHAWQFAPLGTYFLLATLQAIPEDQYKLAKIDGMGTLQRFLYITFPYIRLPLGIFFVLVAGQAATVFDSIYFLTAGGPGDASHTLTFHVYQTFFQNQEYGVGAAQSWVLLTVVIAVTCFYYALVAIPGKKGGRA